MALGNFKKKLVFSCRRPKKTVFYLLFLFCLSFLHTFSKDFNSAVDTNYIYKHSKKISITIPVTTRYFILRINDKSTGKKFNYSPALSFGHGLDIDTKWFSLSITPKFLNVNPNPEVFGRSTFRDIQLFMYPKRFVFDCFYQNYVGFYLLNTKKYQETYPNELYHKRPDIQVETYGAQVFYLQNHEKYSLAAPFGFSTQQLKRAGSFVYGVSGSVLNFDSDSSIVENSQSFIVNDQFRMKEFSVKKFGLNVGYGYNFVLPKHLFLSFLFTVGGGISELRYLSSIDQTKYKETNPALNLNYRISIGFDNGKWYTGFYSVFHQNPIIEENISVIEYDNFKSKIYIGRRFQCPKKIKHLANG